MLAYIRDPRNWSAVKTVTATSYELPVEVAQGESGSITIAGRLDADYSRYMISIENSTEIYKITGQQFGNLNETTITVEDWINATENSVGTVLKTEYNRAAQGGILSWDMVFNVLLRSHLAMFRNFAPPALDVVRNENQDFIDWLNGLMIPLSEFTLLGEGDNSVFFYFHDVLRILRNHGVKLTASIPNEKLQITMDIGADDNQVVHFDDGHTQLITESYNDDICTCVHAYGGTLSVWYLDEDGAITQNESDQAAGYSTAMLYDPSKGSITQQVTEVFQKNQRSHKIEFASDREFHIGQVVRLITQRGIITSTVSRVIRKSNDDRTHYTCGEFPVTAKEILRADSWNYAMRTPHNPRKGALIIEG